MTREYRICSHCVMDTSDPDITFDERGICNHCGPRLNYTRHHQLSRRHQLWMLEHGMFRMIKKAGRGKPYDCLLGVSGGVDSSYLAYLAKKLGLRPLALHVDNGWNSELAVKNIEKLVKTLEIDLVTHVLDWDEFRDLQLAFLKASTPDCEIPTDFALTAALFQTAEKHGIRHILWGINSSTESILPSAWSCGHTDWRYLTSLQKRFGTRRLETFPRRSLLDMLVYKYVKRIEHVYPLDRIDFVKSEAVEILEKEIGWKKYEFKHGESIYTRFYQNYILPTKFKVDKRRCHLASLICTKQITREEALEQLRQPLYAEKALREDRAFICSKLGMTESELDAILREPPKAFRDYPSYAWNPVTRFLMAHAD